MWLSYSPTCILASLCPVRRALIFECGHSSTAVVYIQGYQRRRFKPTQGSPQSCRSSRRWAMQQTSGQSSALQQGLATQPSRLQAPLRTPQAHSSRSWQMLLSSPKRLSMKVG